MTPEEAVKHLRVITKDTRETDSEMKLRMTLREVRNILAQVKEEPVPVVSSTSLGL